MGIKGRVELFTQIQTFEDGNNLEFKHPSPFPELSHPSWLRLYLDGPATPAQQTSIRAILLAVSRSAGLFEGYWLAFEYIDEQAQLAKRIGIIELEATMLKDEQHNESRFENEWQEAWKHANEPTLVKFI
jgi:hypothetical protein